MPHGTVPVILVPHGTGAVFLVPHGNGTMVVLPYNIKSVSLLPKIKKRCVSATNNGSVTTDAYGLFIGGAGTGTVGGNAYALYLSTPYANVSGTSYALYADNPNISYIEGNLGVGTNDPQQKVHVSGVLRLEPQAAAPTGGFGDLYVNTDGTLYFHNGVDWKAVLLAP